MTAVYPGSLPVKEAAGANLSTNPHSQLHDDMYDEIVAIATQLGTSPAAPAATVKARILAAERAGVPRFANAAARNAALSGVETEGMIAYLIDTNTLTIWSGAAWTYLVQSAHGAWTTWTPVVLQPGTITSTVVKATYQRVGRMVTANAVVSITGTGTAATVIAMVVPVGNIAGGNNNLILGEGYVFDTSTGFYHYGVAVYSAATSVRFLVRASAAAAGYIGVSGAQNITLGSGDLVSMLITYETDAD